MRCAGRTVHNGRHGKRGNACAPRSTPGTVRPASRTGARQASQFANWPMFRGDLTHTGVSPETGINATTALTLAPGWSASLGTASFSSPAVVDLKSLSEPVVFAGGSSSVNAYLASSGTLLWTFPVGNMVNFSPAVLNGVVYFVSTAGTVYAVNAKNGALRCSFATGQFTETSPVVAEDPDGSGPVIYFGTSPPLPGQGALNLATGNTVWIHEADSAGIWSSPAVSQNTI